VTLWTGRHNYQLNSATVLRDLYRLVSVFASEPALLEAASEPQDPLRSLRERFLADEVVHLLIGTAIANRTQLDHMSGPRNDPNELSYAPIEHPCGTLWPDVTEGDTSQPLPFREACNKIIHAVNIVPEAEGDPGESPLNGLVMLRGHLRSVAWIAHLDLLEYARASVRNWEDGI
jgi:hypothetical protein